MTERSPWTDRRALTLPGAALVVTGGVSMLGGIAEAAFIKTGLALFVTNADIGSSTPRRATFVHPHIGVVDRLSLFAVPGASLTVALVLAAAALTLIAGIGNAPPWPWARPAVITTAVLAAVVAAVDVILIAAVIGDVRLQYRFAPSTGHLSQALALLAPALLAAATVAAIILWARHPPESAEAGDPDEPWRPATAD